MRVGSPTYLSEPNSALTENRAGGTNEGRATGNVIELCAAAAEGTGLQ